jgi:hypothetical protein
MRLALTRRNEMPKGIYKLKAARLKRSRMLSSRNKSKGHRALVSRRMKESPPLRTVPGLADKIAEIKRRNGTMYHPTSENIEKMISGKRKWIEAHPDFYSEMLKRLHKTHPNLRRRMINNNPVHHLRTGGRSRLALRKSRFENPSCLERKVLECLKLLGLSRIKREVLYWPYLCDFVIGETAIEADSDYWHSLRPTSYYRKRDKILKKRYGLHVVRLKEKLIKDRQKLILFLRRKLVKK